MPSYLEELYSHQEWADAEHWRAFEAHPPALGDKAIRERLLHIHLVQHGFLWIVGPRTQSFETIEVVWFRPPAKITVTQALTQAAMHSHYHRAQNATRLRELGAVPPTTDYILWLHKGKPDPQWQ